MSLPGTSTPIVIECVLGIWPWSLDDDGQHALPAGGDRAQTTPGASQLRALVRLNR